MGLHAADRVAAFTEAGLWGARSWPGLLADQVQSRADPLAVVDPPNLRAICDSAPQRLTWSELGQRVDHLAQALADRGIGPGDVVGVQLPNSCDLVATYLAITSLGAVITPFPVQYRSFELAQMAGLAHATAFVGVSRIHDRRLDDLRADLLAIPGLDVVLAVDDLGERPTTSVTWPDPDTIDPNDDVLLNPFPMVNMAGIAGMFLPWLLTGATLVQHQPFDVAVFFDQIRDEQVTYTVAPPALLIASLEQSFCTPERLRSVRVIGSGSAPLPPSMITAWRDRFDIDVINCFGSNEGISMISDPRSVPDPAQRAVLFPRFGSEHHPWSNRASHGIRSRLIDPADGSVVAEAGVPGELRLIGPACSRATSPARPAATRSTSSASTAPATCSSTSPAPRTSSCAGGTNISPAEIEDLVQTHPAVAEVAVAGSPDPVLGERTRAVVVIHPGTSLTLDQLVDFLRGSQIASYKLPEHLTTMDSLPRNPVGKVLKREIRDQIAPSSLTTTSGGTR